MESEKTNVNYFISNCKELFHLDAHYSSSGDLCVDLYDLKDREGFVLTLLSDAPHDGRRPCATFSPGCFLISPVRQTSRPHTQTAAAQKHTHTYTLEQKAFCLIKSTQGKDFWSPQ